MKKTLAVLYIVVVVVMAAATIVEKYQGTYYVAEHIYGAWWFSLLWALLAGFGVAWIIIRKMRRPSAVLLHASLIIILLGALITHLSARRGAIHLRTGEQTMQYQTEDGRLNHLPFSLQLDSFVVSYHEGTMAATDYSSYITITDETALHQKVSMNHIASHRGWRLYQSSYDPDQRGTVLTINSDPWGIPITYTGYALLFAALLWVLFDPKGSYRQVLRSPALRKGALSLFLFCSVGCNLAAANTTKPQVLPKETADRFAQLNILYNNRICPVETYALDFTKKLHGRRNYQGLTATQVLTGFIFYGDNWSQEPIVKIKSGDLKSTLQLPDYTSVNFFFNPTMGGYILGPYIQEYYRDGKQDGFHKQAAQIDDRLMLVMELRQGTPLRLFPYTTNGTTTWYGPTEPIDSTLVPQAERQFIQNIFTLLNEEVQAGNWPTVNEYIDKVLRYQQKNAGASIPSDMRLKAEHLYNAVPFATILFIVCLTMGFLTLGLFIWRLTRRKDSTNTGSNLAPRIILALSFLALTLCLALRWIVSGTIPMSNGYETMLLMAWFLQLITLCLYHRFHILLTFGFLLSGFFLLVSHISQMDPQIGHLMPVLRSPLLTLHVSIIMMSFALLSLTFICGVTALIIKVVSKRADKDMEALAMLSRVFLYPALTTLGMGIFIGAIWANLSWGTYWSWDPKETWALITFMIYAVGVHSQSLPFLRRSASFHVYMVLAFLTILMTYFGVNYFLGGIHSYA